MPQSVLDIAMPVAQTQFIECLRLGFLKLKKIIFLLKPSHHLLTQEVGGKNKERRKVLNRSLRLEMFSNVFFGILVFGFPIQ